MRSCMAAAAVGIASWTLPAVGLAASGKPTDPCPPVRASLVQYPQIEDVIAGARKRIPKAFAGIMDSQGTHPPVTRDSTLVREVLALSLSTDQVVRLRSRAASICGKRIAFSSWAVVVEFPARPTLSTTFAAFLARTKSRWYLYGWVEVKI